MKFFIFTCLVAVALAKQESAEEINEKIAQTEEQKINLNEQQTVMNQWLQGKTIHIPNQVKNNQIPQFNIPQFLQAVHQQQMPVVYWNKHSLYPYAPFVDYFGHRYPLNPSLNIPYGLWNDNLPPFLLPPVDNHQGNTITKFAGNPDLDRGLSPYPWILTSKVHYIYPNPSYPSDASMNGPAAVTAPIPPPPPPPSRPYPFIIPPKISVSSMAPEAPGAQAVPAVGEGLVPEFAPVPDKGISGLPTAAKLGPQPPPPEPKPPAAEPAPAQFAASEPAPVQFGAPEPVPIPESPAGHPIAPEPAPPPVVAAAQAISAESPAGQSAENKPVSGEPSMVQSIPLEPAPSQSAEVKPPGADPAAAQPPPAEPVASQPLAGKIVTSEPTEVKSEGAEPAEPKPGSQEPQPFLFYQDAALPICKGFECSQNARGQIVLELQDEAERCHSNVLYV
ncbi:Filamentous hemagglutinin [Cricetulus griseus]|uniref:Filamentous hemagglutinin n=1 Tax=Cricetulus griseus TaxID=10029 RepID=G3IFS4_CRIGR|nr:Filamentous hemagglutinin [Cricetulus griseus]